MFLQQLGRCIETFSLFTALGVPETPAPLRVEPFWTVTSPRQGFLHQASLSYPSALHCPQNFQDQKYNFRLTSKAKRLNILSFFHL